MKRLLNSIISMMMMMLLGVIATCSAITFSYNEDFSRLTMVLTHINTNAFNINIQGPGNCGIRMKLMKINLENIMKKFYGSGNCGSVRLLSISYGQFNRVTLIFDQLSLLQEYQYQVTAVNSNSLTSETDVFLGPSRQSSSVNNLSISTSLPISIEMTWRSPSESGGQIIKYIISISQQYDLVCMYVGQILCYNCVIRQTGKGGAPGCQSNSSIISLGRFINNQSAHLLNITNINIKLNTTYILQIQPVNRWGGGKIITSRFSVNEGKSSAPQIIWKSSYFPGKNILIRFKPPTRPNGDISRYQVLFVNTRLQLCAKMSLVCQGCTNMHVGPNGQDIYRDERCANSIHYVKLYRNIETSFKILANNTNYIRAASDYLIRIQAGNLWGWGEDVIDEIHTIFYISGRIRNITKSSKFPITKMELNWQPPSIPNGQIRMYIVVMTFNNSCINLWILKCQNCETRSIGGNGSDVRSMEKCSAIFPASQSYRFSDTQLSIKSNNDNIQPYTNYIISIQPVNEWGWGNVASIYLTTKQYKSGPPSITNITSQFPDSKIKVHLRRPATPNGEIIQYLIVVMKRDQGQPDPCVHLWRMRCFDCGDDNVGRSGSDVSVSNGCAGHVEEVGQFSKSDVMMSVSSTDSSIKPYTKYSITIQAGNSWGWGDIYLKDGFRTSAFKSSAPQITKISNLIGYKEFSISWTRPTYPNGNVGQYLVLLMSNAVCNNVWSMICENCPDKLGNKGEPINKEGICFNKSVSNVTYRDNDGKIISLTKLTNIDWHSIYSIIIQPINVWGWGEVEKRTIFGGISDDDVKNILKTPSYKKIDKSTQISLTIPLNLFSPTMKSISQFSLVVSRKIDIEIQNQLTNDNDTFYDKSYSQCKHQSSSCIYEILIPINQSNITNSNFTNDTFDTSFLIGQMKNCEEIDNQYLCNGPLVPDQIYNIGLRIYIETSFVTMGITQIKTEAGLLYAIIIASISSCILVIIMVAIVTVCVVKRDVIKQIVSNIDILKRINQKDDEDTNLARLPTATNINNEDNTIPMDNIYKDNNEESDDPYEYDQV